MGCTEGHFAWSWHAWLPLILHKCSDTLHKQPSSRWRRVWKDYLWGGKNNKKTRRCKKMKDKSVGEQPGLFFFPDWLLQADNSTTGLRWCCYRVYIEKRTCLKKSSLKAIQMPRLHMGCFHAAERGVEQSGKFSQLQWIYLTVKVKARKSLSQCCIINKLLSKLVFVAIVTLHFY